MAVLLFFILIGALFLSNPPYTNLSSDINFFKGLGQVIGFQKRDLDRMVKRSKHHSAPPKKMEGLVDGRYLKVCINELEGGAFLKWKIDIQWACKNPYAIDLQMQPETTLSSIGKQLGMQDVEVFDERLDKAYLIKCNHRQFPLQQFSTDFSQRLLSKQEVTSTIQVKEKNVHYSDIVYLPKESMIDYISFLVDTNKLLVEMVDNWQPLYKLNQA
ncbi:MAG: hypothetical protein GY810_23695 [Aureispira sp.]|nr:hypothetical protein [Aureispira sp.]